MYLTLGYCLQFQDFATVLARTTGIGYKIADLLVFC